MIDPADLTNRGPRPSLHVPCKVLKGFAHEHSRVEPGDRILLHRQDAARLAKDGLVEVIQPLAGYRQTVAL